VDLYRLEKILCPPELFGNSTSSHLVAKQEELSKEMMDFFFSPYEVSFFHIWNGSLTCRKILRHGVEGFTSPPKEVVRIFIALKNPSL
jgi:hypothetical protein